MAATVAAYGQYGYSPEELDAALVSANADLQDSTAKLKALDACYPGEKGASDTGACLCQDQAHPRGAESAEIRESPRRIPPGKRERFYHSRRSRRYFKAHGITRLPARKALQDEIEQLVSKKSGLYNTYHEQKQQYAELQTVKRNIDQILRRSEPHRRKEQSHER